MKLKQTTQLLFLTAIMVLAFSCKSGNDDKNSEYKDITYFKMNPQGELERPLDYREWVFVGTPVTPNDLNNGKAPFPEMHNVYIDPQSFEQYKATGNFREGTILVKELVSVGSTAAVSGNGYFMGEFIGLEASIKSKEHFPDEPGNWAIFSFTNPKEGTLKDTAAPFPAAACNACHEASAEDDFVFTQYYPVLRAAKGAGADVIPENAPARMATEEMMAMEAKKKDTQWDATAPTPEVDGLEIPLSKDDLFKYLAAGKYKSYKNQEKELHPSLGPHQKFGLPVKVFVNNVMAASLDAGNDEHPMGATMVKEMYNEDETLSGWAVMVKTQATSDNGKGWFWYEVTDPKDPDQIAAIGNGVVGCVSCHAIGRDMVRSHYPFDQ